MSDSGIGAPRTPLQNLASPVRVYKRDASWHNHPRALPAGSGRREYIGKYHFEKPEDPALSACGLSVLLNGRSGDGGNDAERVPTSLRCLRPGCRQRWAAFDQERKRPMADSTDLPTPLVARQTGASRDVLDWIAYMELCDYLTGLCDGVATAMAVMPSFFAHNDSARRGTYITGIPTI